VPTKLTIEILAAAIIGFEEQKKRLDAQIAETSANAEPERNRWRRTRPKEATQDVCRCAGQNCRRLTEEMGRV
jgi:hypothetical protein